MSSIDERVVEMQFNNSQFERGVKTTTDSLGKLKNSLNLDESAKSLNNLQSAGDRFSLAGIANGVDGIASKFSAIGVIGVTALATIASQAVATGEKLVSSLTIDPIKQGLDEYNTNLGAIQTVLANTQSAGTTLKDVNAALNELNHYSDKTIYNFSEMAKNIGTFTAAGVDLKTSTASIKGIANLAALSGSNADQASTAMYQLSQAIAAQKVGLQDWNSVVNAGMGGSVFQRALTNTAVKMGTLSESTVKLDGKMKNVKISGNSFRESLSAKETKGWLTSDVLTKTLEQFTGDMSDAQLAAEGFTKAEIKNIQSQAKAAQQAATVVKTLPQLISTMQESVGSGWTQTWQYIFGDFDQAKDLFTGIYNTLNPLLAASSNARNLVLGQWEKGGGRDLAIDAISNAFKALLAVMKPIQDAFRQVFPAVTGKQLIAITKAIDDFTKTLKIGGSTANEIKRTFAGVFAVLDIGRQVIVEAVKTLLSLFGVAGEGAGSFLDTTASIGDFLVSLDNAIKKGDGLKKFFEGLGAVLQVPIRFIGILIGLLAGLGGNFGDALSGVSDKVNPLGVATQLLVGMWNRLGDSLGRVWDFFQPIAKVMGDFFGNLGKQIADSVQTGDFTSVLDTINTGLLGGIVLLITKWFKSGFNFNLNLGGGLFGAIKETFEGLTGTLQAMQTKLKAQTLLTIAGAVGILTVAVVAISMIDSAALTKSLTAITVMFTQLGIALSVFQKIAVGPGIAKLPVLAASLVILGLAIDVLASAVIKLSGLDWDALLKGLTGVMVLLASVAGTAQLMKGSAANLIPAGIGMIAIATAINILATAVGTLGNMDTAALTQGLIGVAATLATIAGFSQIMNPKGMVTTGLALILLGSALKIIADAVSQFAALSIDNMVKGLIGMAAALGIIAGAMALMPGPSLILTGTGLVIVGAALKIIAEALTSFGGMSWAEIGAGLVVLAGSLAIIAGGLALMTAALPGAAALIVAAGALAIIAPVMTAWGAMDWEAIGKAMVVLAGSLVIIAGALYLMTAALPGAAALIVAAGALAILAPVMMALGSMSWDEIGRGLTVLAGALAVIGVAGLLLTPVIPTLLGLGAAVALLGVGMAAAGAGVLAFSIGLTALGAAGAVGAAGLTVTFSAILGLIPLALEKLGEGLVQLAGVIEKGAPAIVNALVAVLVSLLTAIDTIAPKIVGTLVNLVVLLANTLASNVPKLVAAGLRLLTGILTGIANNIGKIVNAGTSIIVNFITAIGNGLPRIIDAGVRMIISFVNGLANSINQHAQEMRSAGLKLGLAIVDGMTGGIVGSVQKVISAAVDLGKKALEAAKNILGIHSPSKEFEKLGAYSVDGYVLGLTGNLDKVKDAFDQMKSLLSDLMTSSAQDITDYQKKIDDLTYTHGQDIKAISDQQAVLNDAKAQRAAGTDVIDEKQKLEQLTQARAKDNREIKATVKALSATDKKNKLSDKQRTAAKNKLSDLTDARTKDNYEIAKQQKVLSQARLDRKNGTEVKAEQDKLNDLKHTRDKNNQALIDAQNGLSDATDEQSKATAATAAYNEQVAQSQAHLEDLSKQNDDLTDTIKDQTKAVEDATKTRDDFNKSVSDSFSSLDTIDKTTDADTYFQNLEDQITNVNEFASKLQDIRNRGLNDTGYQKLLSSGVGAIPFMDQLLAKGNDGVQEFDSLTAQLSSASSNLGTTASASLYQAGVDSAQGILDGLKSKQADIQAEMNTIATTMVDTIKEKLGIHSPSRAFGEVADFAILGLTNNLKQGANAVSAAAEGVGQSAIDGLNRSISGISSAVSMNMDLTPTITPVLDLSSVKSGAGQINGMLSTPTMSVDSTYASAASVYDGYTANQQAMLTAKSDVASQRGSTIFTQNNYSPVALPAVDIYRRTKNLISQAKED